MKVEIREEERGVKKHTIPKFRFLQANLGEEVEEGFRDASLVEIYNLVSILYFILRKGKEEGEGGDGEGEREGGEKKRERYLCFEDFLCCLSIPAVWD